MGNIQLIIYSFLFFLLSYTLKQSVLLLDSCNQQPLLRCWLLLDNIRSSCRLNTTIFCAVTKLESLLSVMLLEDFNGTNGTIDVFCHMNKLATVSMIVPEVQSHLKTKNNLYHDKNNRFIHIYISVQRFIYLHFQVFLSNTSDLKVRSILSLIFR